MFTVQSNCVRGIRAELILSKIAMIQKVVNRYFTYHLSVFNPHHDSFVIFSSTVSDDNNSTVSRLFSPDSKRCSAFSFANLKYQSTTVLEVCTDFSHLFSFALIKLKHAHTHPHFGGSYINQGAVMQIQIHHRNYNPAF